MIETVLMMDPETMPTTGPFFDFFRTLRLFFEHFFMSPKGPPPSFFDIVQQNVCL